MPISKQRQKMRSGWEGSDGKGQTEGTDEEMRRECKLEKMNLRDTERKEGGGRGAPRQLTGANS